MFNSQSSPLENEDLPEWNLESLYSSLKDPKINRDLETCESKIKTFKQVYEGQFLETGWTSQQLVQAIKDYESIQEHEGRLISFAGLMYYKNLKDPEILQFYQNIHEKINNFQSQLVFFTLEINKIEDLLLSKALNESSELTYYQPWLEKIRLFRPYQLSHDLEKLLLEKSLTSSQGWNRLYDETLASTKFNIEEKTYNLAQITDFTSHPHRKKREEAAKALSHGLMQHLSLFSFITNTLAKDKHIEDTWRGYPNPTSERHLINQVEPAAIESLTDAVKKSYPRLSHRYYQLKAQLLNLDYLEYWDRNAPLSQEEEANISWNHGKEIVLEAYRQFSPQMAEIGKKFFDNPWIDAKVTEGKTSGAFAHPTIPSANPYLLVNYQGKARDVMTLAHELGHGIHQILAARKGLLLADTPLTLAETASVFGEMLTFQSLLKQETNPKHRIQLLAGKIDDMVNTVVRQIAFYEFEKEIHLMRRQREISSEEIGEIWVQTQKEALGPSVHLNSTMQPYWAYISHFIHSPFYVYAYAFGDCLVNSLYAAYQKNPVGFDHQYIELLSAGGTKKYGELLKPFGLEPDHSEFWDQGLGMIESFIDQLEELIKD